MPDRPTAKLNQRKAPEITRDSSLNTGPNDEPPCPGARPANLTTMAHELRTPMGAIIAFAEMIEREQFGPLGDPRYQEYARDIGHSARLALTIIATGLERHNESSDLLSGVWSDIDVIETMEACFKMIQQPVAEAQLVLTFEAASGLPRLHTDPFVFKQIVLNLLGNAIKFTPSGGMIKVSVTSHHDQLLIVISDTGLGMTRFDAAVLSGSTSADGRTPLTHGIGFNLVRRLTAALGAVFEMKSERGIGTTVSLCFPATGQVR